MHQEADSNLILQWIRKIRPQAWVVFFSAVIFGIVCQGMGLTNKYSRYDDIHYLFDMGGTVVLGRWMLHVLGWLEGLFFGTGNTSLPLFNGLLSLLMIGAAGALLADLLEIGSKLYCALLGCLMVAFPFLTALFAYMFTSHYYMLAFLMIVICACLICRRNAWWVKGIAVLAGGASVGIYQAFIPVLLSVLLIYDLKTVSREGASLPAFFRQIGLQALCVAGVMAVYFAGNSFFLAKFGVELSGYQGIEGMGSGTLQVYLERCARAYREFLNPTPGFFQDMYPGTLHILYTAALAGNVLLAVRQAVKTGRESRLRMILLLMLYALIPLGCNFIYVMTETVHALMVYGEIMQFVLLVWQLDRLELSSRRLNQAVCAAASLMLGVMNVMYARFDNQCYLKAEFQQQQAISYNTTLITQIKSLEGYRPELPLYIIHPWVLTDPTVYNMKELDFIQLLPYNYETSKALHIFGDFTQRWCGFTVNLYEGDLNLESLPEVQAMPAYPADGSIRIIRDVIVVKMS